MAYVNVAAIRKAGGTVSVTKGNVSVTTGGSAGKTQSLASYAVNHPSAISKPATVSKSSSSSSTPIFNIQEILPTSAKPEASKVVSAGQDLSLYSKIDTLAGGLLPGGVSPTPGASAAALAALGVGATAALGYGAYTAADSLLFGGKLPLGAKNMSASGKRKIRHMNYDNPKALKRSERRLTGFMKHYKKHVSALGYKVARR